tara:strand:+ start:4913 stop:5167 length:255 start_codon:yes stop_codon:yes gene_type:complete
MARMIMSRAATVAVIMIVVSVVVIATASTVIAGAAVVIMTGMGVGALHRRGGNRRSRQFRHVEPERANLFGDILRGRFARRIAG